MRAEVVGGAFRWEQRDIASHYCLSISDEACHDCPPGRFYMLLLFPAAMAISFISFDVFDAFAGRLTRVVKKTRPMMRKSLARPHSRCGCCRHDTIAAYNSGIDSKSPLATVC